MTNIEDYLFQIYNPRQNRRLYNKLYYQKNKKRILDYNNKRYDDRLKKGDVKFNEGTYIIKFN
jgi:hypothetical protein